MINTFTLALKRIKAAKLTSDLVNYWEFDAKKEPDLRAFMLQARKDNHAEYALKMFSHFAGTTKNRRQLCVKVAIYAAKRVLPLFDECKKGDYRLTCALSAAKTRTLKPSRDDLTAMAGANAAYTEEMYKGHYASGLAALAACGAAKTAFTKYFSEALYNTVFDAAFAISSTSQPALFWADIINYAITLMAE